jgi:hypothetical protein
MNWNRGRSLAAAAIAATAVAGAVTAAQQPGAKPAPQPMGFFITSAGPGQGGNLGGLDGADKHCQTLAAAAGAGNRAWRAYLSTQPAGGQPGVNARDRIGTGPWYNAKGQLIAANVEDLHGDIERDRNNIRKPTALDEKGGEVAGVGDKVNQHDMLTGSDSRGRTPLGAANTTSCDNWTSSADTSRAMLGHHDRLGGANASWNAVHLSAGCSQESLVKTGGAGLFYCFAAQ